MNILIQCLKVFLFVSWWPYLLLSKRIKEKAISVFVPIIYQLIVCLLFIQYFSIKIYFSTIMIGIGLGGFVFCSELLIGFRKMKFFSRKRMKISKILVSLVLISPFTEELYFRVLPWQWISQLSKEARINGVAVYILVSSLVVVVNHIQAYKDKTIFLQKFFIEGTLISIIFAMYQSYVLAVIIHFTFNCINLFNYYSLKRENI